MCVLGFSRETEAVKYTEIYRKTYYEGLLHANRLSGPTICHLQTGDPGKQAVQFQPKPQGLRTRGTTGVRPRPSLKV